MLYSFHSWKLFLIISSLIEYNCPIIQFLPLNRFHRSTTTTMTSLPLYILVFCKESSLLLMIGLVSRYRDWISASTIQPETLNRRELLLEKLILHFRFFCWDLFKKEICVNSKHCQNRNNLKNTQKFDLSHYVLAILSLQWAQLGLWLAFHQPISSLVWESWPIGGQERSPADASPVTQSIMGFSGAAMH